MQQQSASPRTTVILPAYNAADYLERAVRSVLAQTDSDFELIVVDDHSSDGTLALATSLAKEFSSHVSVIALPANSGVSVARNAGLAAGRGAWFSFIDSDDEYLPTFLETMHGATDKEIDMVVGGRIVVQPDGTEQTHASRTLGTFDGSQACRLAMMDEITPFPWDKLVRRGLFEQVQFAEGAARFEDMANNIILHSLARRVRMIDAPIYRYYIMDGSLTWGRVPTVADTTVAMNHLDAHLAPRFKEGKYRAAYACMKTLVILLVAQSAVARGSNVDGGSTDAAKTIADARRDISLRMLLQTLSVNKLLGVGATLLKFAPALYSFLYLRHIGAAYGVRRTQKSSQTAAPNSTPGNGSGIG